MGSTYYGTTGSCQDFTVSGGEISGYTYATPGCTSRKCDDQDEDTLIANLGETGPASICVDASEWSSYNGDGVFDGSCSSGYYSLTTACSWSATTATLAILTIRATDTTSSATPGEPTGELMDTSTSR